jgi:hyperosmotically inducible periplasmic protein
VRFLWPCLMAALLCAAQDPAQQPAREPSMSPAAVASMAKRVQNELLALPEYGVFDVITFSLARHEVTLRGFASRPTLKEAAEKVVARVEGVKRVENLIEVLALSPNDDILRGRVYAAIYGNPVLARYNPNRGVPVWMSPARVATGITNDPPPGFHPIHIIVKGGSVKLTGVVDNEGDRNLAGIQAETVPGIFSLENNLISAGEAKPRRRI